MKNVSLTFMLVFMSVTGFAIERNYLTTGRSVISVTQALVPAGSWNPYPVYTDRDGWDQLFGNNRDMFIRRGEKMLNYEWKVLKATDYLAYERTGDRNIMQIPNSDNNNALTDLAMAELAEGKGRFMDQIINGVFYECERTSWVLSAHLTAQQSKRTLPDHTEQVIDLGSGDLGAFLSWVYHFFHDEFDKVNPVISLRLRDEIYNRIILPYRNNDHFWWMAFNVGPETPVNNWNPWTNFNCLQSIVLLEDDMQQLGKDVYRSMISVDKFMNYINADGACEEGPSYWGHAAGKLYDYLKLLSMITGGKISLFDRPMIRNMGEYISRTYVGNDWVVNFADASAKFSAPAGLIYRYGKAVESKEMTGFSAYLVKNGGNAIETGTDFFRVLESVRYYSELMATEPVHEIPEVMIYPETQFYYFSNKRNFFLAAKGGYNAESHNHNDAGTCSLWVEGTPVLIDAGVGAYTRQTFGPERYTIWTMRSGYHNLPDINGEEQQFGKQYKATGVRLNEKKKTLSVNLSRAYPESAEVNTWLRNYRLTDDALIIEDRFDLKKIVKPAEIHFMLWGNIKVDDGKISIDVEGKKIQLSYDPKIFDASLETIPLSDDRLSKVWGKEIYRLTLTAKKQSLKGNYIFKIA